METGTEVPIHKHPTKDETFVLLRGRVKVTTHNDDGSIIESVALCPEEGRYGVNIPKGVWDSFGAGITEPMSYGVMETVKSILKGIWGFCGDVFGAQRRPQEYEEV